MENKERKKAFKEVRKYIMNQNEHIAHHCCAVDFKLGNEMLDILCELEEK